MATTEQLAEAEEIFRGAEEARNTARSNVLDAKRLLQEALDTGASDAVLRNWIQLLERARLILGAADAIYTRAQENLQTVFDAVDPTAASQADPVVRQAEARAQQQDPPLEQVQFRPDPVEIDSAGLAVTDEDLFEQDNPIAPEDTEDEFAGNGYGFEYDEYGELIPADDPFTPDAFSPAEVSPDSDPAIPTGRFDTATADDIAPVSAAAFVGGTFV